MSGSMQPNPDDLNRIQTYQQMVLKYEALDEEIDALLTRFNGATENMPDQEFAHYRRLAYERDETYNQMKELERQILLDDDSADL
ncbi:MAG TPA: hypothetical protein PKD09_06095 [Aggregatilinea sp.]|nr:hypothetical protein [Aggregatilinea sp.]